MVIWSLPAKADLRSIHNYIAKNSPFYAKKVVQDIREKTDALNTNPKIGKKVVELNDDTIRELSKYSYRILYEISSQQIEILAIVHKRQDFKADNLD